jgi:structure-specific recognition protein 1
MRPKLKAEAPDLTFGDLGKKMGELFRALSPQEKEKYEKMAERDKVRYNEEMTAYAKKSKSKEGGDSDDDDSEAEDSKPKAKAKKAESDSESDSDSDED